MHRVVTAPSAHVDRFVTEHLPPRDLWPVRDFFGLASSIRERPRLNAATELLGRAVDKGWGARPVLHFGEVVWSYQRLHEQAERIARVLVEDLGLQPGNRVLLRSPNNPMLVACWFAVLKAGAICVTTPALLRARELEQIVTRGRIHLALCDVRLADPLETSRSLCGLPERLSLFTALGRGDSEDADLDHRLARKDPGFADVATAAHEPAILAFTSGTTGEPKGAVHDHRDLLAICECFPHAITGVEPDEVFCGSPPVGFTFGLGALITFPVRYGASAVLLEKPNPEALLKAVSRYRVTTLYTAPTAYRRMLETLDHHDWSSLSKCVSAGETLPESTFRAWREATGVSIVDGLGTTEMLHIFVSAAGDAIRPGATGKVVPGYRARAVDDEGHPVPPGRVGHLVSIGPTGCRYLNDPVRQQEYVRDGWNFTGDLVVTDEDGYFWYQSRSDDMIVSSGYNIAGPEVENVLLEHPGVRECAVVGVPDPERGHQVKAFVVLREGSPAAPVTEETLKAFVVEQISPWKAPRQIELVSTLPRTVTGKVQRFKLREAV